MKVLLESRRDGYSTEQCGRTMTVEELIEYLEQFDEDAPVYISNDNGYTYGRITENSFEEREENEE
ncbi:MAG: hypothetical protein HFE49_00635 [Clostridia bacterium]|nr:hypothetical protein [Clostridia bacterium]